MRLRLPEVRYRPECDSPETAAASQPTARLISLPSVTGRARNILFAWPRRLLVSATASSVTGIAEYAPPHTGIPPTCITRAFLLTEKGAIEADNGCQARTHRGLHPGTCQMLL